MVKGSTLHVNSYHLLSAYSLSGCSSISCLFNLLNCPVRYVLLLSLWDRWGN